MSDGSETPFIDQTIRNHATVKYNALHPSDQQIKSGTVPCIIEVPRGSANKYEYEKSNGMLELDRVLHSCVHYPGDYGFVPNTLCGDGDPIDVLVLTQHTLISGCVAMVRIIGVMDMIDEKGSDAKLLGVLEEDMRSNHVKDLKDVDPHVLQEIKRFFENYKKLESKPGKSKWAKVDKWHGVETAREMLRESRDMFLDEKKSSETDTKLNEEPSPEIPMPNYYDLPLGSDAPEICPVYVEVARENANRYVWDKKTGFLTLEKVFDSRLRFPGDFGFIPQTACGASRTPMYCIMLSTTGFQPGVVVQSRIIGCLELNFNKNEKNVVAIGVTHKDPRFLSIKELSDMPAIVKTEIKHFFQHYGELFKASSDSFSADSRLPNKNRQSSFKATDISSVNNFLDRSAACAAILDAMSNYSSPRSGMGTLPRLGRLPIGHGFPEIVSAMVETSRGSMNKYAIDEQLGVMRLDRVLPWAMYYPADYGFIPQTHDEDGDPLDIVLLTQHSLSVGVLAEVRIVCMMSMEDEKGPSAKIIAVPKSEPRSNEVQDLDDVPNHVREELKEFFSTYKTGSVMGVRWTRVTGFHDKKAACDHIRQAHSRYYVSGRRFEELAEREKQTHKAYTDKIQGLERRNADLERRLAMLEAVVRGSSRPTTPSGEISRGGSIS